MGIGLDAIRKLREQCLLTAAKNMGLYHFFSKMVVSFKALGIPVMALKGIYLAEAVYGGPARRTIGDIDLLVREKDLGQAEKALLALGYRPMDRHRVASPDIVHFSYRHPDTGLIVDIHWNILPPGPAGQVDSQGLWERSRATILSGQKVLALCPEDQILFLCAHISKHAFQVGLRALSDLFEVIKHFRNAIDWKRVPGRAGQWGISKSTYFGLRLCRELFRADVPERCLKGLRPQDLQESCYRLAKAEIAAPRHPNCEELWLSRNIARLWGAQGLGVRLVYFLKRTFPSRAEMARLYPVRPGSWKLVWYYPYRVGDLVARHGRSVWRRFCGDKETRAFTEHEKALNDLRDWIEEP
jgi:hypothetical protein